MILDPSRPNALAMQFHGGVFRSVNGAETWTRISTGLPNDFGFPMVASSRGELFVVPLLADTNRVVPDGALTRAYCFLVCTWVEGDTGPTRTVPINPPSA